MSELTITVIRTAEQLAEALRVRTRVFVEEQGVPREEEIDGYDAGPASNTRAVHVMARLADVPVVPAGRGVQYHRTLEGA